MISALNSISNPIRPNMVSVLSAYKTAKDTAAKAASAVYQSFYILSGAEGKGITLANLNDLKHLLEEKELSETSAYELVSTLTEKFSELSSDGEKITEEDIVFAVKYAVAQNFSESSKLASYLKDGKFNVSKDLIAQFGFEDAQTITALQFLENLSDDIAVKIASRMKSAEARETADHRIYGNGFEQNSSNPKITLPLDIKV